MDEINICKALSCSSRWKILKTLSTSDSSIEEIAKNVNLSPMTVRHHVTELEKAGIIVKKETPSSLLGRPKSVYSLKEDELIIGFPNRNYKLFRKSFLKTLTMYFNNKNELYEFLVLFSKEFIEELESFVKRKNNPPIAFLVQSGFPEALHSRYVEQYLVALAERLHSPYLGTLVRGGCEGVRLRPEKMNKKLLKEY